MSELRSNELERFVQELAGLLRAGIPLPEGLREVAESAQSGRLKALMEGTASNLEKGQSLREAIANAPVETSEEFRALAECLEVSGDASAVLSFAVEHQRRMKRHNATLLGACIYPLILVVGLAIVMTFLANSVYVTFLEVFTQLGAELPALTTMIMAVMGLFEGVTGILIMLLVVAAVFFVSLYVPARERALRAMMLLPGFAPITAYSDTALLCKFLGVMLAKGVPLPVALRAARLTVSNPRTQRSVGEMTAAAEKGIQVSPYLSPQFPATAVYLFRQGEERGTLAEACDSIAEYCEEGFSRLSTRLLVFFEPALILAFAVFIGVTLIGLYIPLFSIPKVVR